MKELVFEELTVEQKLGLVLIGGHWKPFGYDKDDAAFHMEMIKKHALGAVWVSCNTAAGEYRETIRLLREAADYPLLICTDMESGFEDYRIGDHIALGYLADEAHAHAFGRVVGYEASQAGYSVVCNPLLDRVDRNTPCGGVVRSLHPDKEVCAHLAAAMARGMQEGGVLTVGKHYPSARSAFDTHMAEASSPVDRETLIGENLYPYRVLMKDDLLDGVMVGHTTLSAIDPDAPATVSKPVKDVLRSLGFDGLMLTDAMTMMGVVQKFGLDGSRALSISTGNDLCLPFSKLSDAYASLEKAYKSGVITDERLDEAVRRVLAAQHNAATRTQNKPSDEDYTLLHEINRNGVAAITDEGVSVTIPRDGRHLFVLLTEDTIDLDRPHDNDSLTVSWYDPFRLADHIKARFPASAVASINEFPPRGDIAALCNKQTECDDIIFVTFFNHYPYIGDERFTPRIISMFKAWQISGRLAAVVHFGNPYLLEDLPHLPRVINACKSFEATLAAIDVLAGKLPAKGKIPYNIRLQ